MDIPDDESDALVITWSYTEKTGVPVTRFIVALEVDGTDQCTSSDNKHHCVANTDEDFMVTYTVPTFMFMKSTKYTVRVAADSLLGLGAEASSEFMTGEWMH